MYYILVYEALSQPVKLYHVVLFCSKRQQHRCDESYVKEIEATIGLIYDTFLENLESPIWKAFNPFRRILDFYRFGRFLPQLQTFLRFVDF